MFGRLGPITFREYLWLGDLQYRRLGDLMVNSSGLTGQPLWAMVKQKELGPPPPTTTTEPIYGTG